MFALDIDLNVLLGVCVVLGVLCFILLFVSARRKRDSVELQQDLNKNIEDFNRLLEKFDAVTARKNQLEQEVVKAQTTADGLQIRLNERDEKVQYLQTELNEEQARHSAIAEQMTTLKERFGVASAQADSLRGQLAQSQAQIVRKEESLANLTEKHTALSQELAELKTTLTEKEKHFVEQQ